MSDETPKPGSVEAGRLACTCPVIDNHYGRGFVVNGERVWVVNEDCPLHGRGQGERTR